MPLGLGTTLGRSRPSRGPDMAPGFTGSNWSLSLNGGAAGTVTQDTNGINFIGANNIASAFKQGGGFALNDNSTYEVTFTISGLTAGGARVLLGAATINHGATGTTRNANGTYTEQLAMTGTFGSTNIVRIQATGASGSNNFTVSNLSIKEVLS